MVNVVAVTPGLAPGFVYTVDAGESDGHEFLLAGRVDLDPEQASDLLLEAVEQYPSGSGRFTYRPVLPAWGAAMLLAVPEERRWVAIQVREVGRELLTEPRCDGPFPDVVSSAWWFLSTEDWAFPVPAPSWVGTTDAILRGAPFVSLERWEEDYWELLDTPVEDVDPANAYVVPFACLLDLGVDVTEAMAMPIAEA